MIVLLVVLAGCSGTFGDPAGDHSTEGPTVDPTTTVGSPPATGTRATEQTPFDATESNTLVYADLSASHRRVFDAAVDGNARFVEQPIRESPYVEGKYFDPDLLAAFEDYQYVRRNGTYYRISTRFDGAVASYSITAITEEPTERDTVIAFEDLPERLRDPVRWAIENGSYDVPPGKWASLPEGLSSVEYVRYSGKHYRMEYTAGDARVRVLIAEKVG